MANKRRGLGKNLSELLSITPESLAQVTATSQEALMTSLNTQTIANPMQVSYLPLQALQRGKYQPRKDMNVEALEDLASSIKAQGVLQPIVVRSIDTNRYEIIAGERRWRAAQIAGLESIPAIIRDVSDQVTMAVALIENIQRENLNPVEEASAIQRLIDDCQLTHQEVADSLGKPRATVSNLLRVLSLNPDVKTLLEHGDIEFGHAKALLSLKGSLQSQAANIVVAKGLSVRETEALIKKMQSPVATLKLEPAIDPDVRDLQGVLSEKVGAPIKIIYNSKGKGKLIMSYNNLQELENILAHIK